MLLFVYSCSSNLGVCEMRTYSVSVHYRYDRPWEAPINNIIPGATADSEQQQYIVLDTGPDK